MSLHLACLESQDFTPWLGLIDWRRSGHDEGVPSITSMLVPSISFTRLYPQQPRVPLVGDRRIVTYLPTRLLVYRLQTRG
jgi:hypothetical protein